MGKLMYALIIGAFVSGIFGCAGTPAEAGTSTLTKWNGTWNNFHSYFDRPALNTAYAVLAEKEGKTQEEIKTRYLEGPTYQCEIAALGIHGRTITFYKAQQSSGKSESGVAYKADFNDMGDVDINGRIWRHFSTARDIPYKHLLLLPAEADIPGVTMMHFHFRYGQDLETIRNADGWYATMTAYDSTDDLLIGHMIN